MIIIKLTYNVTIKESVKTFKIILLSYKGKGSLQTTWIANPLSSLTYIIVL